ncbi:MAG TPA: hemerythrin domain-containing protein [Burkholderiaceae bacterium]|nr:hemerythrin domain-containing protein [Burkholderiaceae bacterium]
MPVAQAPVAVFDYLDATHRQVAQSLQTLSVLVDALSQGDLSEPARARAREVLAFFGGEARQHHLDEEKHVFPPLLESPQPDVVQAAHSLSQDHGWLEENWLVIAPMLEAAAEGSGWFDTVELANAVEVFAALYHDHIVLEESLAYPAARSALSGVNTEGMGREMARRRALAQLPQD